MKGFFHFLSITPGFNKRRWKCIKYYVNGTLGSLTKGIQHYERVLIEIYKVIGFCDFVRMAAKQTTNYFEWISEVFILDQECTRWGSFRSLQSISRALKNWKFPRLYFLKLCIMKSMGEGFTDLLGVYHPPFDTLKICTSTYDMKLKLYRQ